MTQEQYNSLLPFKTTLDAMFMCIDKDLVMPSISRSIENMMIEINGEHLDTTCGACVTEVIKKVVKQFRYYEDSFS